MSNNKQSMKLYTTDQVIDIFEKYGNMSAINARNIIDLSESIELPSDEEIIKIMELDDMEFDEFDPYHVSHLEGAKWMRDKIQGGNNEQK
jgi:hypothetical protein